MMEEIIGISFWDEKLLGVLWLCILAVFVLFHWLLFRSYRKKDLSISITLDDLRKLVNAEILRSKKHFSPSMEKEGAEKGIEEQLLLIQLQLEALKKMEGKKP